jgi:uncharacterized protein (UPF0261 family)
MPLRGVSAIDVPGAAFHSPEADTAYRDALKAHLDPRVKLVELDANINDESFSSQAARTLLELMSSVKP